MLWWKVRTFFAGRKLLDQQDLLGVFIVGLRVEAVGMDQTSAHLTISVVVERCQVGPGKLVRPSF